MIWLKNKYSRAAFFATFLFVSALQLQVSAQVTTSIRMPYPRFGMCSARIEDKIYLIGGAQSLQGKNVENVFGTSTVQAFNLETMKWDTNIAPLETPRVFACAVAMDDSIYVMGGVDSLGNVLNSVEVYDPSTNRWHYTTPMILARKGAAAVGFGDYILVFGGGGQMGSPFKEVEAYSLEYGIWKSTVSMALARAYHKVVRIKDSIYILGGNGGQIGLVGIIERYIPTIGTVQIGLTLSTPKMLFGVVEREDSVYVISGMGGTQADGHVDLLNLAQEGAEQDSVLPQTLDSPRIAFVAALGGDGHIYLFGGISPGYKAGTVADPDVVTLDGVTPVREISNTVPAGFKLDQNYPNPFNPTTTINFDIPSPGSRVNLDVYNMLGQRVKSLVNGFLRAGNYSVSFNGENMPSGTYIYRLQTENGSTYRKMVLIK